MLFLLLLALLELKGWLLRHHRQRPDQRAWRRDKPPFCRQKPKKPAWVRREIIRMKALMPEAGCRRIADTFNRRFADRDKPHRCATVGKSFVAETIRKNRYDIAILRRTIKHRVPPPMPRHTVWAIDLTGKGDASGAVHPIFGLLDHGSRALLNLTALPNKSSWTLLGHLFLSIGKYGKPRAVRTDNETVFVSRLFRTSLKLASIRHQRSDPGCPWQNGRIERLFLTLKEKLDRLELDGYTALTTALPAFRLWYNHIRPHQHLNGNTPAEAWAGITLPARTIKQELWFEAWDGLLTGYYLRR